MLGSSAIWGPGVESVSGCVLFVCDHTCEAIWVMFSAVLLCFAVMVVWVSTSGRFSFAS